MKIRVISALLGLPFSIFIIFLGGNIFNFFVLFITILAMHEFFNALKAGNHTPYALTGYIAIVILFLFVTYAPSFLFFYFVCLILFYLIYLVFHYSARFEDVALSLFGILYIGTLFSSLILLRQSEYGLLMTFYLLILSWGTDTFAFLIGRFFGKHKLVPKISPNKTVEGAIGGLICSSLLSLLYVIYAINYINIPMPNMPVVFAISCFGSLFSQLGDLSASLIKRKCGIKDFGNIIPGHGGILDRFDSLIFASAYLYLLLFLNNRFMFI